MRTTIVAEIGTTWERDLDKAMALVDLCAAAGVDCVKSQWTSDPEALCVRRKAPEFLPAYRELKWPEAWHGTLAAYCQAKGLGYSVTAYLPKDVPVVAQYTSFFKVSAFEATAADMFKAIRSCLVNMDQKKVVVSLGFGTTREAVIDAMFPKGRDETTTALPIVFLHCVSSYPAPIAELNLGRIRADQLDGFSDHTAADDPVSLKVGALAVAAGARWIERHVKLDSCRPTHPDAVVSLGAHQLAEYVTAVREAEQAPTPTNRLKDVPVESGPRPSEEAFLRYRVGSEAETPAEARTGRKSAPSEPTGLPGGSE